MAASSGFRFVQSHGTRVDMDIPAQHSEVSIAPSIQTTWQETFLAIVCEGQSHDSQKYTMSNPFYNLMKNITISL